MSDMIYKIENIGVNSNDISYVIIWADTELVGILVPCVCRTLRAVES